MSGISDCRPVAALRRQMTISVPRQVASAGNLANVDTGHAGGDVSAAQTVLAAKFRLVRYAINEGT